VLEQYVIAKMTLSLLLKDAYNMYNVDKAEHLLVSLYKSMR